MDILTRKKLQNSFRASSETASKEISDVLLSMESSETSDRQMINDEIMNHQIGVGYSPEDRGFISKDAYDSLGVDSSGELSGRNLSD